MRCVFIVFLGLVLGAVPLRAQTSGSIFGKVIDAKTKQPVAFVAIFLANTMLGTNSDDKGMWRMKNIPPGKYDLTLSSVGYQVRQIPVLVTADPVELNIELSEDVKYLKEVTVKAEKFDTKKWQAEFIRYFVGHSPNARECTILNLDKINLDYDKEVKLFTATCDEPIQIVNDALGYKISYLLVQFVVDYTHQLYIVAGIPRFEELTASDVKLQKWQKARERAYYGSKNHFMRSLISHRVKENKFELYKFCGSPYLEKANPDSLFDKHNQLHLPSNCSLRIVYKGHFEQQVSQIKLLDGFVTVFDNGYYEDQLRLEVQGHYSENENTMAELLPLEFASTLNPAK